VFKLGFRPSGKRYKRVTITPVNNTGNAFVAGVWLTRPLFAPTRNPRSEISRAPWLPR